jgi:hypothetical protein
MPQGKILTKQALYTLAQLHSELAGKLSANLRETKRPTEAALLVPVGERRDLPTQLP